MASDLEASCESRPRTTMHIGTADSSSPLPPIQQPHSISFSQPVNPVWTEQHGALLASVIQLLSSLSTPHPLQNTTPWLTREYICFISVITISHKLIFIIFQLHLQTVVRVTFRLLLLTCSFCLLF